MFAIDYRSRTPLYQQIVDNVERLALAGVLPPDSQLPSVRALAVELSLNPNTVSRAYGELENRGVIYSLPGRGNFVASDQERLRQNARRQLSVDLLALASSAHEAGLAAADWDELTALSWQQTAYSHTKEGAAR